MLNKSRFGCYSYENDIDRTFVYQLFIYLKKNSISSQLPCYHMIQYPNFFQTQNDLVYPRQTVQIIMCPWYGKTITAEFQYTIVKNLTEIS